VTDNPSSWGNYVTADSDIDKGGAPRGRARSFHQMPNLVVPQDFDAPLPDAEYAAWEGATDHE
jgi:hypothetical protein